jgi:L-proline amide hydrolase
MLDPEKCGYIQVDGGAIWYRANGFRSGRAKKPPIIIVHGGPGATHRRLLPLTALANEYPVIFYDQLDSGNSSTPNNPQNWTVERFASEIGAVADHFGLQEYYLLGYSAGGTWAIEAYRANRDRIVGLILLSPLVSTSVWERDGEQLLRTLPQDHVAAVRAAIESDDFLNPKFIAANSAYAEAFFERLEIQHTEVFIDEPPLNDELYEYMWGPTEFVCTGTLRNLDLAPKLTSISAPTLFVSGEYDNARPDTLAQYARSMPNAQQVEIKSASHSTPVEAPAELISTIRSFLDSIRPCQADD